MVMIDDDDDDDDDDDFYEFFLAQGHAPGAFGCHFGARRAHTIAIAIHILSAAFFAQVVRILPFRICSSSVDHF